MAIAYEPLHLLLLLAFSTCCFSSISTSSTRTTSPASSPSASSARPQRLVSKLIHHRSVHHPCYNPNETARDRMERDIQHSVARLAYLQGRIEGSLLPDDDYRVGLSPSISRHSIVANLSIGNPPTPQLVVVDTASDLFWIMCIPCTNCLLRSGAVYDPSKSSTYFPLCRPPCGFNGCRCSLSDQLPFNITYADGTFTSGTLGRDMLAFETSDEGTNELFDVQFGCGHKNGFNSEPGYSGILGLNNAPLSLASQIGLRFSYCIGSLTDKDYNYNQLILGEGADFEGYFTTFQVFDGMYFITMEGISIGEKRLDIAPGTFERKENGTGGVLIDTGSTFTYLVDDGYKVLYKEVRNLLDGSFREVVLDYVPWLLCYAGTVSRDLVGFPVVTFHFAEDADLALDTGSLFEQTMDNVFCMAVGPISVTNIRTQPSVIGLLAQQSYNVGYDLVNQFISFQRIDCELLSG